MYDYDSQIYLKATKNIDFVLLILFCQVTFLTGLILLDHTLFDPNWNLAEVLV